MFLQSCEQRGPALNASAPPAACVTARRMRMEGFEVTKEQLAKEAYERWHQGGPPFDSVTAKQWCSGYMSAVVDGRRVVEPEDDRYIGEPLPLGPQGPPQSSTITGYDPSTRTASIEPGCAPRVERPEYDGSEDLCVVKGCTGLACKGSFVCWEHRVKQPENRSGDA
jgi:hypothetical protein